MRRLPAFVPLLFAAGAAAVWAQSGEPRFTAVANRTRLYVGENLNLTLTLEGPDVSFHGPFPQPDLRPYFRLVNTSGPSTTQSINIINNRMERTGSIAMGYVFTAQKEGMVTIPEFQYQVGNRVLRTQPIKVEILAPAEPRNEPRNAGWQPLSDPYLELKADKHEVYVGEQIVVSWFLYFQESFEDPRLLKVPAAGDFMVLDLGTVSTINPELKEFGGEIWQVAFLKSLALFPIKTMDSVIEPLVIGYRKHGRVRDFFGDFFMEERQLASDPLTIKVKPLPEEGRPTDFTGAVGRFTMNLDAQPRILPLNTPFKFTLIIEGTGHPDFIPQPQPKLPEGFDLFTESAAKDSRQEAGKIVGVRKYRLVLVAHQPGEFDLPPFRFSFFDPEERRYQTLEAGLGHIRVTGSVAGPTAGSAEPVKAVGEDLRYIKPSHERLKDYDRWLIRSPAWLSLQSVPLLLVGAAYGLNRRRRRLHHDTAYARKLKASRKVKASLAGAKAYFKKGDGVNACASVAKAVTGFLADQFTLPEQGITTADAIAALRLRGLPEDLIADTGKLLDFCDRARFAPATINPQEISRLLQQGEEIIARLSRETKK